MAPFARWLSSAFAYGGLQKPLDYQGTLLKDPIPHESVTIPTSGAIACESVHCSNIGAAILREGGNAVDATIAAVLCVGVIGFYHSGIGGGGFATIRSADGQYEAIDFRESAPAAAHQEMYRNNYQAAIVGGLAVAVPGELKGLEYMHRKYGSKPWRELVMPAVRVARYGWRVNQDLMRYIGAMQQWANATFFTDDPSWAVDLAPNGKLVREGDIITRKRYADTLETLANHGILPFYEGAIAQSTIQAIKNNNGTMEMEDLSSYEMLYRNVSQITYRGYKLSTIAAPASGTVALHILKLMEGFEDIGWPETRNISTHRMVEAIKWGYAAVSDGSAHFRMLLSDEQRTRIGDPEYADGAYDEETQMLNETNIAQIRAKISDNTTFAASYYDPDYIGPLNDHGTAQISAADETGLAISITSTINTLFGSQIMVPETGIILNNEMDDFSIPGSNNTFGFQPSEANLIRPGKRPLSSVSTVIVESSDGKVNFVTGAAGGSRIPTATVQSIWNVIDRNMSVHDALKEPRIHDQIHPAVTNVEPGFDTSTAAFLKSLGHNVTDIMNGLSAVHAVRRWPDGSWEAVGEPRQRNSAGRIVGRHRYHKHLDVAADLI